MAWRNSKIAYLFPSDLGDVGYCRNLRKMGATWHPRDLHLQQIARGRQEVWAQGRSILRVI